VSSVAPREAVVGVAEGGPPRRREERAAQRALAERDLRLGRSDDRNFIILAVLFLLAAFGLIATAPGLGVVLAVLATPALIRAGMISARRQSEGAPLTGGERVGAFLASLGVVVLTGVAAVAAFYGTCFAVCAGEFLLTGGGRGSWGFIQATSIGAGVIVGVLVLVSVGRKAWRTEG
jgi:hypothetical protein